MVEKLEHGFVVGQWTYDLSGAAGDAYSAAKEEVERGNMHLLGDWMLNGKTTTSLINKKQFTARMRDPCMICSYLLIGEYSFCDIPPICLYISKEFLFFIWMIR